MLAAQQLPIPSPENLLASHDYAFRRQLIGSGIAESVYAILFCIHPVGGEPCFTLMSLLKLVDDGLFGGP